MGEYLKLKDDNLFNNIEQLNIITPVFVVGDKVIFKQSDSDNVIVFTVVQYNEDQSVIKLQDELGAIRYATNEEITNVPDNLLELENNSEDSNDEYDDQELDEFVEHLTNFTDDNDFEDLEDLEEQTISEEPIKTNVKKPMFGLIPQYGIEEVAKVFTFGFDKYGAFNYEKHTVREYIDKTLRHINDYMKGKTLDESGYNNLAHAASNLLMALDLIKTSKNIKEERNPSYNIEDINK